MTPALYLAGFVLVCTAACVAAVAAWRVVERRPLRALEAWNRVNARTVVAVLVLGGMPFSVEAGALPGPGRCRTSVFKKRCDGRVRGLHRSAYVFAVAGNSLVEGADQVTKWTTRLSTMLTKSGVSYTLSNLGHGGYATEYLPDRANFSLIYKIPTEVDPLWDSTKNNVLILQEVINDLYYGSSAATAYANVRTYFQTTARQWDYRIVVMPTPRDNPGTPVGYETERQDFITLVNADPTFGGWVDAVWRVDQDDRLGDAADCTNAYYYYISGGADTKVHWVDNAGAIAASAIMRILTAAKPSHFPYRPQYAPYPSGYFSAATAGSILASSGGAATDGQTVATWVHDGSLHSGNMTTNSGTPLYETTGFGNQPSVVMASTSRLVSASNVTYGRGTIFLTFKASANGFGTWTQGVGGDVRLYVANDGDSTDVTSYQLYGANYNTRAITQDITDSAAHVMAFVFTGSSSAHAVYVDGELEAGTNNNSGEPGDTAFSGIINLGHPTQSFAGEIGEVFVSPIPMNATELGELKTYFCTLRGVTCS